MSDEAPLSPDDRAAMRAYLQRAEVRISTQHRVGTAFIGGAGLLLLIPIFLRDVVDGELSVLLGLSGNLFPSLEPTLGLLASAALLITLGFPLILSLFIPMYGVYRLLADLVHFYFTLYMPGFDHDLANPTFALGGINFSPDESDEVKRRVMKYQYVTEHMDFLMPFSSKRRELYFDKLIEDTHNEILPPSRDIATLRAQGIIDDTLTDDHTALQFNTALGIARAIDRSLVEEVAISEMHLARNTLYLRRLMLRYVKVLLLFIWTTVISFIMLPMLRDERYPTLLVLALGYTGWSIALMPLLRTPANWIYRYRREDPSPRHLDLQLQYLEQRVRRWVQLAMASSLLALVLSLLALASGARW